MVVNVSTSLLVLSSGEEDAERFCDDESEFE